MGPMINSEYDEESPFMGLDNNTLYFSCNGPKSMGEFDIFSVSKDEMAKLHKDGKLEKDGHVISFTEGGPGSGPPPAP